MEFIFEEGGWEDDKEKYDSSETFRQEKSRKSCRQNPNKDKVLCKCKLSTRETYVVVLWNQPPHQSVMGIQKMPTR